MYALVAVSLVTIFRAVHIFNLAQGSYSIIAAFIFLEIYKAIGGDFWLSLLAAIACAALMGVIAFRVIYRPLLGRVPIQLLMVSIGLDIALSSLALTIWGPNIVFIKLPHLFDGVYRWGWISISKVNVVIVVVAVVLISAFGVVLKYTKFGLSMRATSDLPVLSTVRGIRVGRVSTAAWAIALAFGVIAAVAMGSSQGMTPNSARALGIAAVPAAVIGGIDSIAGALCGSLVLAEVQMLATQYVGGAEANVVGWLLLLIFLVVRPTGLFGRREVARL